MRWGRIGYTSQTSSQQSPSLDNAKGIFTKKFKVGLFFLILDRFLYYFKDRKEPMRVFITWFILKINFVLIYLVGQDKEWLGGQSRLWESQRKIWLGPHGLFFWRQGGNIFVRKGIQNNYDLVYSYALSFLMAKMFFFIFWHLLSVHMRGKVWRFYLKSL